MPGKTYNILTIDGGGVRGVYPAYIMQCLEERLGINAYDHFDMFAGTSTGSIIVAGIVSGKSPAEIVSLYKDKGEDIFSEKIFSYWPNFLKQAFHSKYKNGSLADLLESEFGTTKLGDISKPLLIPATDIATGGVHVFKSQYSVEFTRDKSVLVREAVLASCSAPAFFDPVQVGNFLLSDGGVWANNPSLAAVIDAQYRLGIDKADIRVLSLGTGLSKTEYGMDLDKDWGIMKGWGGRDFIDFLLSLQAQSTQNYLQLLLEKHQLLRLNFESDNHLPLDDVREIDNLIAKADKTFTHQSADINNFLMKSGE